MINIIRKSKKDKNFLDFVPIKNPNYLWHIDEENLVVVEVIHVGIINKIAQKIFKVPQKSDISLDEYGSFVWQYIDGKNTIHDISIKVSEKFGKDAEPLLNRLVQFFRILKDNSFVSFKE